MSSVIRVYNTLTRIKEEVGPARANRVRLFVCGPTVYDDMHLGHARTYLAYDLMARYLRYRGYSLFFLMNITDIDDKIIDRAGSLNLDPIELARRYETRFYEDMKALGIDSVNLYARASEHLPEIIEQGKGLLENGYAYETETGLYYDISKFEDYGKLSHQKPEELGEHRIEPDPTKRHPEDFSLWKKAKPGEPFWESPWGKGRPGWHIEDTAITLTYFGPSYDIHGGAIELVFPHHEAEIAQAEALTGIKPLVRYWVHTGILFVGGQKMAKSLGNFITVRDILKEHKAEVLRMLFASTLYRSPLDFTVDKLEQASRSLATLYNTLHAFARLPTREGEPSSDEETLLMKVRMHEEEFIKAMDDDFNTPVALSSLFSLAGELNRFAAAHRDIGKGVQEEGVSTMRELGRILEILQEEVDVKKERPSELADKLMGIIVGFREELRKSRRWEEADRIRAKLEEFGVILEDTDRGTEWRYVG